MTRVHAFSDDALADHDTVALADLVKRGEVSPDELVTAARARLEKIGELNAVAFDAPDDPRVGTSGQFAGVPTFLKDNMDLAGMPTNHGSEAWTAKPAKKDGRYTKQFLSTGLTVLGKSALPEFGFNASTEFQTGAPVRNPWHTDHSIGASSGGAAALVATGVVPIAHANDGGGSIRIPAACGGLVGLKPSRGRHVDAELTRTLPVNMVSEGVLTRSVRDTAAFHAAMEDAWRNPKLAPLGLVEGPSDRKLRVGVTLETVNGAQIDAQTRAAVQDIADLLASQGHVVEPAKPPVDAQFAADFLLYWGLLATLSTTTGKITFDRSFDTRKLDGLTRGLMKHYLRTDVLRTAGAIRRLRRVRHAYAEMAAQYDVVVSPVLAHVTPKLGHLSPTVPFDVLIERLEQYVAFTPLNNIAGTPALSMPVALAEEGVPIGVQFSAGYGDERTLLELAYVIEDARPRPRIQDAVRNTGRRVRTDRVPVGER